MLSANRPMKMRTLKIRRGGKKSARSTGCGYAETSSLPINNPRYYRQFATAMRFGDLPSWAVELSNAIHEAVFYSQCPSDSLDLTTCEDDSEEGSPFTSHLLWREPLFDQLIMNTYQPGEGICAHVDLIRFEDGIANVSLESPCIMHFTRVQNQLSDNGYDSSKSPVKIPVYLSEGSLVLMSGEARYHWKHEINRKPGFQKWEGRELAQRNRTSITLRKLCTSTA